MNGKEGEFRIAPARESFEMQRELDAIIVIPSLDEGEKIIDTIFTAVRQAGVSEGKVRHGIVVVINNKPDSPNQVKANNFRTYLLLQALEHKFPIALRGDSAFGRKVKFIQEQNVPIHIVDSFSEGFAHPNSNVGRARRIGTEAALARVKPEGFIVSTDADTRLGDMVLAALKDMFDATDDIVGTRLSMSVHLDDIGTEEKRASAADALYWGLLDCVRTERAYVEDEYVWMAGGGSAFRAKNYRRLIQQGKGYTDIPGHEDTLLGSAFADEGWAIRDMSKEYPDLSASTRHRFSERASIGFGQRALRFDQSKTAFKDIPMESVEYMEQKDKFLHAVQNIYHEDLILSYENHQGEPVDNFYSVFSNRSLGDPHVERFIAETKEEALQKFGALCDTYGLDAEEKRQLIEVYQRWKPNQEMGLGHHDFLELTKKIFERKYPKIPIEEFYGIIRARMIQTNKEDERAYIVKDLEARFPGMPWRLEEFERMVLDKVGSCGVDAANEDALLKTRVAIAASYKEFYVGVVEHLFLQEMARVRKENLAASDDEEKRSIASTLDLISVPKELLLLRTRLQLLGELTSCINDVRNALFWEQSKETLDALGREIYVLEKEATDFYRTEVKAPLELFADQREKNIALLEREVERLDMEKKAL